MNASSNVTTTAPKRTTWVKPSVHRIEAGSAEFNGRANVDGGVNQS